ncbi:MAG: hypothetical protein M3T55_06510 [Pseudomonadota bacterium]|nr:hypothetical protein [Pseudomonadota bacterium]
MLEVELFLIHRGAASADRDPSGGLSGWKSLGKGRIVDLPSVGDQIRIAPDKVVRVRGVMHLAAMEGGGLPGEPAVRLMVEFTPGDEVLGPTQ